MSLAPRKAAVMGSITVAALVAFDIPVLKCEGFEADDVIATVTTTASRENNVIIVTADKDCRQLLGDDMRRVYGLRVRVWRSGMIRR